MTNVKHQGLQSIFAALEGAEQGGEAAKVGDAGVKLVSNNAEPEPVPQLAEPPARKPRAKSATQRFNRKVKVLYGPTSARISAPQAKEALWSMLRMQLNDELTKEQTNEFVAVFDEAVDYGDVDGELALAFVQRFKICVKCA